MNTEDDEFDRIEREQEMRKGQPYIWEADAIKAAVLIEREACARLCELMWNEWFYAPTAEECAEAIRARGYANDTSSERVDINGERKREK